MSVDPVTAEVISNKLGSVADEMSVVLIRSSVSTNIKEREDCSTSVFDADGRLLYQAENIPLHLGSLQGMVSAVAERYRDDLAPGEMFIGNDPYEGGGTHLPDIVLVAPVFHGSTRVGFVANLGHHADFVQRRHHHVFEEGIRIPPLRVRRDGAWSEELLALLMANFQVPAERAADLEAQVAANLVGVSGFERVVETVGLDTFRAASEEMLDYAERQMRRIVADIPAGAYSAGEEFDSNEIEAPIPLGLDVEVDGSDLRLSFDAPPQVPAGLNMVRSALEATCYYAIKSLIAAHVLPNAGMFRAIRVEAPAGSVLNAELPAAVFTRSQTCQRVVDLVYGALQQALADRHRGQSHGTNTMVVTSGEDPRSGGFYAYIETLGGGGGAGPGRPGVSAVQVHVTNTSNLPVESLELEYPLEVVEYALIEGSEGAGSAAGGRGIRRRIRILSEDTVVEYSGTRLTTRPRGSDGGEAGGGGRCWVERPGGAVVDRSGEIEFPVDAGDVVGVDTPGGGGFGPS
jgi:N-methylhydantoinase B